MICSCVFVSKGLAHHQRTKSIVASIRREGMHFFNVDHNGCKTTHEVENCSQPFETCLYVRSGTFWKSITFFSLQERSLVGVLARVLVEVYATGHIHSFA